MDRATAILMVLIAYLAAMLGFGLLTRRHTKSASGFYLGGRTLGPWVTALAANASSSSAWSLVGTSGFACQHGLGAVWLLPGCIGGFLLNWLVVAPRVRAATGAAVTMTELLAGSPGQRGRGAFVVAASVLILAALLTYVAAQMQAAGGAFQHAFTAPLWVGIVLGAALIVGYTLLGGYLAASLTDTVQGLLMAVVAVVVPVAALVEVGGPAALLAAVQALEPASFHDPFGGRTGIAAAGFALGLCGIGLGYPGQPHAINKYMGMSPGASMAVARTVGIGWAVVLYSGMLVLGWCVRVQWQVPATGPEEALYEASHRLFPPLIDGVIVAAVLAAIMSTVDSQLLVCASTVTHDLGLGSRSGAMLRWARGSVLAIGIGATLAALVVPKSVFDNVMFAWAALGSAFGPLLLVHLLRGPVAPLWGLATLVVGGGGAIVTFHATWPARGFLDRVGCFGLALVVAWIGAVRGGRARGGVGMVRR